MSLVQKLINPELQKWLDEKQITGSIDDILSGTKEGFYTPEKAAKAIGTLVQKVIDDEENQQNLTFENLKGLVDEGDYIEATGHLDYSQSGEPSLFVHQYKILTKSLRPLPEKMDYENTESRYLDRVADFKMNTKDQNDLSVREVVRMKAKYWDIWRDEMAKEGFMPVECPIFESVPGGAEAKPFTTFYNELDQEMYLRISLELPLKKLIAGGFERVYEIGRIFRNEGSSPQHLQEYTQIEWYCAYTDYDWAASFMKRVYQRIVEELLGKMTHPAYNGKTVDWSEWCSIKEAEKQGWELVATEKDSSSGWPKIKYFDAVRYFSKGKIDTENKTPEELVEMSNANGIPEARVEDGVGTLLDRLWKKARVNTTHPFFLVLPPVELEPLAKRDPSNKQLTQRWQIVAGGAELGKAFSELNDPIDQFGRFETQQEARDAGNEEAQFMDLDYVKAMEYGMPPMSGFGMSERFVSFLLGKHIKDCTTFPHVRQENKDINKVTKVFHIVLNNDPSIPEWQRLNASSHLTGSVIAHNLSKRDVIDIEKIQTKDGMQIPMDLRWGIHLKKADNKQILDLYQKAVSNPELKTTVFGEEFFAAKDDLQAVEFFKNKDAQDIKWIGVLLYGPKSKVEKLTSGFAKFE
jgi:lysyl-tRNA synthetase, class II